MTSDNLPSLCQKMARSLCGAQQGQTRQKTNLDGEWATSQTHQHQSFKQFWKDLVDPLSFLTSFDHSLPLDLDVVMVLQWVNILPLDPTFPHLLSMAFSGTLRPLTPCLILLKPFCSSIPFQHVPLSAPNANVPVSTLGCLLHALFLVEQPTWILALPCWASSSLSCQCSLLISWHILVSCCFTEDVSDFKKSKSLKLVKQYIVDRYRPAVDRFIKVEDMGLASCTVCISPSIFLCNIVSTLLCSPSLQCHNLSSRLSLVEHPDVCRDHGLYLDRGHQENGKAD